MPPRARSVGDAGPLLGGAFQKAENGKTKKMGEKARLEAIHRARVWVPTSVPEMDLRAGPQGEGSFAPNEMVTCDYLTADMSGTSRKFSCEIAGGDIVKVRYGADNGKVEGAVLSTRLLWALGFGADRVYPVRVTCRGCSPDPWNEREHVAGTQLFDPAVIERKPEGRELESRLSSGWAWPELDLVDEAKGGAPRVQRDALKLLAVLIQHTDNKPINERFMCLPGGDTEDGGCSRPFLMLHDVGLTFGHANFSNNSDRSAVNFDEWSKTPVWRDAKACVAHMSRSYTGTLGDPKISDGGRQFLADLLARLTDRQLHDLFDVARVEHRSRKPGTAQAPATVGEWVAAFKHKRDEIVDARCPS